MNEYDAKRVSIEINGKEIWSWDNDEWCLPKDNSKENQDRLLEDFKYKQSQPLPSKQAIRMWCIRHFRIPERDY